VVSLSSRKNRGVSDEREMDTGVRNQVSLELIEIDIERTIESQGGSNRRDNLGNQSVEVFKRRTGNVERLAANVIDCLVVNHKSTVGVLKGGVRGENGVVGLNNRGRVLGSRVDGKFKLGLFAIVDGKALKKQSTKTGTGTTTKGVCEEEALEAGTVVSDTSNSVYDLVNKFLADSVMTTSIVVGSIFLASDELLRVEEVSVLASSHLVNHIGFEIDINGSGNIFAAG
jgi:hypothetical protein